MYTVTFADGTIFKGGEPRNSLWNDMPNKAIESLEYRCKNKTIKLSNYEAYNHVIEYTKVSNRLNIIIDVMLMVKNKNDVLIIKLNLNNPDNPIRDYDVKSWGKEYRNAPHIGWKQGIINSKPKMEIL